ncbi:MAG: hypothetical protein NG740_04160 [Omnitrophica bacterium]|nr:hypothetical protein [Candidatus Omnitrophota bacterium]
MKRVIKRYLNRFLKTEQREALKRFLFWRKKINYDATLHWCVNEYTCNLNCVYCPFPHTKGKTSEIDSSALVRTIDKTGKIFRIALCGNGEPFLVPNIIEACTEITKRHYISLVTNLVSKKIEEFCKKINPRKVLFILASLHIKELERDNLTDRFVHNFLLCQKKKFSIRAQEVAYPSLLSDAAKYKKFFRKKGIELYFDEFCGKYKGKSYPDAYTNEERKKIGLISKKNSIRKRFQYEKFCNAGYNTGFVFKQHVYPCFQIKEKIGNIYGEKIELKTKMIKCPYKICQCPINMLDDYLFKKALEENKRT